ncbi:MAG: Flp family type IVb pilin [Rhodoblastus sp.]|nr:Flp family type IVb pilin [Rhodoblastus sp.]
MNVPAVCKKFLRDENASSAIEYSLIAGLLGLVLVYPLSVAGARVGAPLVVLGWAIETSGQ